MRFDQPVRLGAVRQSASGGQNIDVAGLDLPGTSRPNERVSASLTVKNNRNIIAPTDPDVCDPPKNLNPLIDGLRLRTRLLVDGREVDRGSSCVPGLGGENEVSLSFATPDVGRGRRRQVPVTLLVEGGGSGNELVRIERSVVVRGEAPAGPDPDPGEGGGGGECSLVDALNPVNDCSVEDAIGAGGFAVAGGFVVLLVLVLVLASI